MYSSPKDSNIISVNTTNSISYNQPNFDPYTVWNPNAITIADSSIIGSFPHGIFIDKNNTIYVPGRYKLGIFIWRNDSFTPTKTISTNSMYLDDIFVSSNGDIYTSNYNSPFSINKWTSNGSNSTSTIAYSDGEAYGMFIDNNNTLYFSCRDKHKVVSKPLSSSSNVLTIVAGTGQNGNAPNMLNRPHGIFVDTNLDLYVADADNHRIQLFPFGQLNATTIAGSGSINVTISLNTPIEIVLDADKYLFIVNFYNHRIIGSGPNGFRCIIGCTGVSGSLSNTLNNPSSMAFDTFGNIFVVDQWNSRIQKFIRLNNTLGKYFSTEYLNLKI